MTAASAALTSPGQLAANLPGILGFYPHDSLIFAAFNATDEPNRFTLGPVLRLDLSEIRHLPEVARALEDSGEELIFAFVVTDRPEEEVEDIIDTLITLVRTGILPVQACWVADEILTGETIVMAFGPMYSDDDPWVADRIAPVHLAPAMEALLEHGELPDLSREESIAAFRPGTPVYDERECEQLTRFAHTHARELPPAVYPELSADLRLLLDEIVDVAVDDLLRDEETLLTVGTLLGTVTLRDLVMENLLAHPEPAAQVLLAVARTFRGTLRHHALAVYALCAIELGMSMKALPALLAALREDPGHTLSDLVYGACQAGQFDTLIEAVRIGSRQERAGYGVAEPCGVSGVRTRPGHPDGW